MRRPALIGAVLALTMAVRGHAQVSGISAQVLVLQVSAAQLPAPTGTQGLRIVTDALSDASCTVGGGTVKLVCFDNGAWAVVGSDGIGSQGPEGPAGPTGADGQAASIAVGGVTTGAAGTSAAVVNSGTSSAAVLDFTIPRGDTGAAGATGADGAAGAVGATGPQGPQGDPGAAGATGATGPAGPVAGTDTQVIFNDAGAAAGDAGLTYNKTTDALTVTGFVNGGNLKLTGNTLSSVDTNGRINLTPHGTGQVTFPNGSMTAPGLVLPGSLSVGLCNTPAGFGVCHGNGTTYTDVRSNALVLRDSSTGAAPGLSATPASATNPNVLPSVLGDGDTGIGAGGADDVRLIAGGSSVFGASRAAGQNMGTFFGAMKLTAQAAPPVTCSAGTEGVIYTDTSHALCYCNGTAYANLTPADGGSCV